MSKQRKKIVQVSVDGVLAMTEAQVVHNPTGHATTATEVLSKVEKELLAEATFLANAAGFTFEELFPAFPFVNRAQTDQSQRARHARRTICLHLRTMKTKTFAEVPTLGMICNVLNISDNTVYKWASRARANGERL